ncbi:hypothetical protein AN476_14250, partial [Phaeobacter sp. 11ANDIMAR09]
MGLPGAAKAAFDSGCPTVTFVLSGNQIAFNFTDDLCIDTDPTPASFDGTEKALTIEAVGATGSTSFFPYDGGGDPNPLVIQINGVNLTGTGITTSCSSSCSITGSYNGVPFSSSYQFSAGTGVVNGGGPGPAAAFSSPTGGGQSATISTAYSSVLTVVVEDSGSTPVPGTSVTFSAPGSGASGTFASTGTATETVTTDASGVATSSTFTANSTAGSFNVTASSSGISDQTFG